jgi:hypothetical protein
VFNFPPRSVNPSADHVEAEAGFVILSSNIPLHVDVFLDAIYRDFAEGRHSSDYRGLLLRETRARYPGLVDGLRDLGRRRKRPGDVSLLADADHIVPKSVWPILIPLAWNLPGAPPDTPHLLSNLFWRTVTLNRGAPSRGEAVDLQWIGHIKREAAAKKVTPLWARQYIEFFLRTKHDEGVNIDVPMNPHRVNDMVAGPDVSSVIEFVQMLRRSRPRISSKDIADAVETRFPHIRIEMDGAVPRIEIG